MATAFESWSSVTPKRCLEAKTIPPRSQLFQTYHISKTADVSEHELCISCYSAYVDVCSQVAEHMKLPLDKKKEFKLSHLYERLNQYAISIVKEGEEGNNEQLCFVLLPTIEKALILICACIRQRMYHHQICTRPAVASGSLVKRVSKGSMHSDENHDVFIIQLCYIMNKLYKQYLVLIDMHNLFFIRRTKVKLQDKVRPMYEVVFDNCNRKLQSVQVDEDNVLDKKNLVSQRAAYIEKKTETPSPVTKTYGSRAKPKKKYSLATRSRKQRKHN